MGGNSQLFVDDISVIDSDIFIFSLLRRLLAEDRSKDRN